MGLDVYLYHKLPDFDEWDVKENQYHEFTDIVWDEEVAKVFPGKKANDVKYDAIPEEVKDAVHARNEVLAKELGLEEGGNVPKGHKEIEIEKKSRRHPKHYFKIGYFRSSYNDSGTNHVLSAITGKDLYWIFTPPEEDSYRFTPDWQAVLARAIEARDALATAIKTEPWQVMTVSVGMNLLIKASRQRDGNAETDEFSNAVRDEASAINVLRAELAQRAKYKKERDAKKHEGQPEPEKKHLPLKLRWKRFAWQATHRNYFEDSAYSNAKGEFFPKGFSNKIRAILTGVHYGEPAVYIVYDDDKLKWYLHALDIVVETIKWVLKTKHSEEYQLHWSG
jgi:hypothetical protein